MSLEIRIPPEMENDVRERALAVGQDVQTFVLEAVHSRLQSFGTSSFQDISQWEAELNAWIDSHPKIGHAIDDSRDTIYGDRGL